MKPFLLAISICLFLTGCSPYAHGPVFTLDNAESTFDPVIEFLEIEPGMTIADVGAGSGALTVIMSTRLRNNEVYIQDIDQQVLSKENVDKMIAYYSKKLGYDLGRENTFHLTYGTTRETNLPDHSIDRIYSNATIHVFDDPDAMLRDMKRKLTPGGLLFIRDGIRGENGEGEYCTSKDCGKPLLRVEDFLKLMEDNGYRLVKQSPDLQGYPVFGFSL